MKKHWGAFCLFLLASAPSWGVTGNDLLRLLQSSDASHNLQAYYFISGITQNEEVSVFYEAFNKNRPPKQPFTRKHFCVPEGSENKQSFDIVQRELELSPETRQQYASIIVRRALIAAWPCAGNPK